MELRWRALCITGECINNLNSRWNCELCGTHMVALWIDSIEEHIHVLSTGSQIDDGLCQTA